ncbi:MAG: hypothetical protein GWN01_07610 [Nitrosopumilaceae archaeon]|nr:hypothetical protein [Nitrosopumilaceae archaeon]NIU87238.1 hypothetical protein [Nitrosopumilaceae archaeon]NIV65768.1 hypothetical protein [Nitrosopumilaceae archaeon]NIX61389.1 hypothetical protein [Nitrosopumilaceae archaeon]
MDAKLISFLVKQLVDISLDIFQTIQESEYIDEKDKETMKRKIDEMAEKVEGLQWRD